MPQTDTDFQRPAEVLPAIQGQGAMVPAGGQLQPRSGEVAATAAAALEEASVKARYALALHRPRSLDDVRTGLVKACQRSRFAKAAWYKKPVGRGVEGLSIRFVEEALRQMTNVYVDTPVVYEDEEKRVVMVLVTDLETNITHKKGVTITKTVERHDPTGRDVISARTNQQGKTVYLVRATDDEILNKENALISKALRVEGLRILPAWIKEECEEVILATRRAGIESDPDAERKTIVDAFASKGVRASDLKNYLGIEIDQASPAELGELRGLYEALRDGETSWREIMDYKRARDGGGEEGDQESPGHAALKEKIAKHRKKPEPPEQAAPEEIARREKEAKRQREAAAKAQGKKGEQGNLVE